MKSLPISEHSYCDPEASGDRHRNLAIGTLICLGIEKQDNTQTGLGLALEEQAPSRG